MVKNGTTKAKAPEKGKLRIGDDWNAICILKNFVGALPEQVAERMIELSLYPEEKLKLLP